MFTPLVLSSIGGMGREETTIYKWLENIISQKRPHPYPTVMGWLRCRLSSTSLHSAIMCTDITLATSEGRMPIYLYFISLLKQHIHSTFSFTYVFIYLSTNFIFLSKGLHVLYIIGINCLPSFLYLFRTYTWIITIFPVPFPGTSVC